MPAKKTLIRASTQEHLPFSKIQDNLIILKNGSCSLILKTTAINFGLLSEKEQEATIFAYSGFLNSLSFPIQIFIHSRQKDVSSYLSLINQELKKQKNKRLRIQLKKYNQFIQKTVKKNKILDKNFYIIIPFVSVQFKKLSNKKLLEKAKIDLSPKRDHLIGQFQRLGLKTSQLTNQELIKLFYHIYNPESLGQKFVSVKDYSSPLIQLKTPPQTHRDTTVPQKPLPPQPQLQPQPAIPQPQPAPPPPITNSFIKPLLPKQEKKKPLEGEKLQEKINNIVKKVSNQQI